MGGGQGGEGRGDRKDPRSETVPADKNNGFSKLLVSEEPDLKTFYRYIMYIHSKTRELRFLQQ